MKSRLWVTRQAQRDDFIMSATGMAIPSTCQISRISWAHGAIWGTLFACPKREGFLALTREHDERDNKKVEPLAYERRRGELPPWNQISHQRERSVLSLLT